MKNEYGVKLDRNGYAPSVLGSGSTRFGTCRICGRLCYTERHEVFFGIANRERSKRLGLWVTLCDRCHRTGKRAVHNNRGADLGLKASAQIMAMNRYGWTLTEFMDRFGRSWI